MKLCSRVMRWLLGSTLTALCVMSCFGQDVPDAPNAPASTSAAEIAEAHKLIQEGRVDEAITKLQAVQSRDSSAKGVAFELGNAYYKKNDFSQAIDYLRKANAESPQNQEATQLLGMAYFASGHPGDAIPLLEKVQELSPHANADGYFILGTCYIQIRNYDGARKAFGKMFNVPGDSAPAYLFTARMLLRQEFDPVAEQYAQKAVALDSTLPLAHYLLGELNLYKARLPEAIAEFKKELEINPAHAPTYYKLGDAYARSQKYDDAQAMLQRSIRLDSTSSVPFILMGQVLEKKGEYDLAVLSLKHAVTMEPNNPTSHYLLGQAYREMGRKDDATAELKRAQDLHGTEDLQ